MGPIGGDELSIRRQQEAARNFRRQLEDKRAVIENNLLTGRQHLDGQQQQMENEGKMMTFTGIYQVAKVWILEFFC